ncbi:hypothetical protein [Heyndrickxia oleronia]|nr:hypothetical protein [Heyndrickxia oleronia]
MDRYTMAWQISLVTNFSDEYLLTLSTEELEKLYQEKVERYD